MMQRDDTALKTPLPEMPYDELKPKLSNFNAGHEIGTQHGRDPTSSNGHSNAGPTKYSHKQLASFEHSNSAPEGIPNMQMIVKGPHLLRKYR